jgi:hypothetical protein
MTVLLVGQELLTNVLRETCPHLNPRTTVGPLLDLIEQSIDDLDRLQATAYAARPTFSDPLRWPVPPPGRPPQSRSR